MAIRQEVAAGKFFADSEEMVEFLKQKFKSKEDLTYYFKTIDNMILDQERSSARLKKFKRVQGSSQFHVIIFSPGETTMKAAKRICVCEKCKESFGTCENFIDYTLSVQELNKIHLRSSKALPVSQTKQVDSDESGSDSDDEDDVVENEDKSDSQTAHDFICPDSIVAVAADERSADTIWFIKVLENECVECVDVKDDYENVVVRGESFFKGHFLEMIKEKKSHKVFKLSSKITFFYKESVIYPFINMEETDKGFHQLHNNDLVDIINFAEANNYCHL